MNTLRDIIATLSFALFVAMIAILALITFQHKNTPSPEDIFNLLCTIAIMVATLGIRLIIKPK